jgi:hypothetical protein
MLVNHVTNNSAVSSSPPTPDKPPSTPTSPTTSPQKRRRTLAPYTPGELGKLAQRNAQDLAQLGWFNFFHQQQHPTSIHPSIHTIPHPTAQYLSRLACAGAPTISTIRPWTLDQKDAAFRRGPHISAKEHSSFLMEDMYDYTSMRYWTVLPYSAVRHLPQLRLAPAGVVPQRERRPRPIMDYSYYDTNPSFLPMAPNHAMQFGKALPRILQRLTYCNPAFGPPLLAKIDLADGYYRVPVSATASLHLAVVLPPDKGSVNLIALPLSLPMGWNHSPPYFCAYTESVADMANSQHFPLDHPLLAQTQLFQEPQQQFATSAQVLGSSTTPPLQYTDVYLDDFILIAQQPLHLPAMNNLLHSLYNVFIDRPHDSRRQLVSTKKLQQGDATFSTKQRILGWDLDTVHMTISLPQHRLTSLKSMLQGMIQKSRTSRKRWHKLLGTLRSTTPALYGASHAFSILQHALTDTTNRRIKVTPLIREVLRHWLHLAQQARDIPAPLATVVPTHPTILAATDASKAGMGGFWVTAPSPTHPSGEYYLWRHAFSDTIKQALITADNPSGTVTINDLELMALITGAVLAAKTTTQPHPTILHAADNTAAIAWSSRGSTTSISAPAFLLHHFGQLRQANPFTFYPVYTPGSSNTIADCCSRSFDLSNMAFLPHIQRLYPIKPSWKLVTPPSELILQLSYSLFGKLHRQESTPPAAQQMTPPGTCGKTSALASSLTPNWWTLTTLFPCCNSSPSAIDAVSLLPVGLQSALAPWKAPFVPWARRSPHWDA